MYIHTESNMYLILQTILTHSRSRVVLQLMREAVEAKKRFNVYVTESLPDASGSVISLYREAHLICKQINLFSFSYDIFSFLKSTTYIINNIVTG